MTEQDKVQRTVLPTPDQPDVGLTTYDVKDPDTKYPPIRQLRPPSGAPNVLIVLIDDVGFGASSVFGGQYKGKFDNGWDKLWRKLSPGRRRSAPFPMIPN